MIDKNYVYEIPEELKESMMRPGALPELGKESAKIITQYARKYRPIAIPDILTDCRIRDLLSYERMTKKRLGEEERDYWIKVYMLLIDRDLELEESFLEPSQRSVQ